MNELEKLEKAKQDIQDKIDKLKNETTIKVGNWYKGSYNDNRNIIFYAREIDEDEDIIGYGFVENGWSYNAIFSNLDSETMKTIKPATNEEVEAALIKEAKKRGFKEGVKFKGLSEGLGDVVAITTVKYDINNKSLYSNGEWIFKDGQWSEIIEEPKVVINGYEIKKEGYKIKFGCAEFSSKHLLSVFDRVDRFNEKTDDGWSNRKIKYITLDSGVEITVKQLEEIVKNIK